MDITHPMAAHRGPKRYKQVGDESEDRQAIEGHTAKTQALINMDYGVWANTTVLVATLAVIVATTVNKPTGLCTMGSAIFMQVVGLGLYVYVSWGDDPRKAIWARMWTTVSTIVSMVVNLCLFIALTAVIAVKVNGII